jgi:hypothetical protein
LSAFISTGNNCDDDDSCDFPERRTPARGIKVLSPSAR